MASNICRHCNYDNQITNDHCTQCGARVRLIRRGLRGFVGLTLNVSYSLVAFIALMMASGVLHGTLPWQRNDFHLGASLIILLVYITIWAVPTIILYKIMVVSRYSKSGAPFHQTKVTYAAAATPHIIPNTVACHYCGETIATTAQSCEFCEKPIHC